MSSLIRYMAVGRLTKKGGEFVDGKHQIIAFMLSDNSDTSARNFKDHVQQIMDKGSHKLKPGKRLRLTSDDDDYDLHVMSDLLEEDEDRVIVFFVVTDLRFNQAHNIGKVFDEFRSRFLDTNSSGDISKAKPGGSVNKASQLLMMDLSNKYGHSKLLEVQNKVDEVKIIMQENVATALDNVESMHDMEQKSDHFENRAQQFQKSSTNLKKMMRCRYYKVNFIIGLLVVAVLTIIILQLVPESSGDAPAPTAAP